VINAVSQAWVDGQALRTLSPLAQYGLAQVLGGGRRDSRGVRLALIAKTGEMGYPSVLSAKGWASTTSCSTASRSNFSAATALTS